MAGEYSGKVQQLAGIPVDSDVCAGTVTCGDRYRWTPRPLMACKRSGLRLPLAPHFPRSKAYSDLQKLALSACCQTRDDVGGRG